MKVTVVVNDRMQRTLRVRPHGAGRPQLRPRLRAAADAARDARAGRLRRQVHDRLPARSFPPSWFTRAKLCSTHHDPALNYFGVNASQSLATWWRKGWIRPQDPRGWFQWYCRYYMGRRSADDARQIRRWRAMARHVAQIVNNCDAAISNAGGASDRLSCTGRMTAARSDDPADPDTTNTKGGTETRRARSRVPIRVGISAVCSVRRSASTAATSATRSSPTSSAVSSSSFRSVPKWKPASAHRARRCTCRVSKAAIRLVTVKSARDVTAADGPRHPAPRAIARGREPERLRIQEEFAELRPGTREGLRRQTARPPPRGAACLPRRWSSDIRSFRSRKRAGFPIHVCARTSSSVCSPTAGCGRCLRQVEHRLARPRSTRRTSSF